MRRPAQYPPKLLARMRSSRLWPGIEQHHPHRNGLVGKHLDAADLARLVMIVDAANRALVALGTSMTTRRLSVSLAPRQAPGARADGLNASSAA